MRVRFTASAQAEFVAALAYIHKDKPGAAQQFRAKAEESLRRLHEFPESGRIIPEFPDLPYREVIVAPYRFFYKSVGETVWIAAVWHGAQIPSSPSTTSEKR